MPTGYTSEVPNGQGWEEFVWRCARAMGALVLMRDEPLDAPIPERFAPSEYYAKEVEKARKRLTWLRSLSQEQVREEAAKAHEVALKEWEEGNARSVQTELAYRQMLDKARSWNPPTAEHLGLKTFMIEQLASSIECDCGAAPPPPQPITPIQWLAREENEALRDIGYHETAGAEEVARTNARNRWITELRASVPTPSQQNETPGHR